MKPRFAGKVAWITGASSGIGRACALELARQGASVVVTGRRRERLVSLRGELEALGVDALDLPCDVRKDEELAAAVDRLLGRFGRLDVALANAGFAVGGRIEELSGDDWRRQLETNVIGAALTARHAIPALERTRGRLALTGSVAGFVPAPSFGAYHASKYALRALGATLSIELAPRGVSCTLLHPGFVESEINQVDDEGRFDPSRVDRRPRFWMWPTDRAARVMVDGIYRRKRELVFTGHGRVGAWLGMHFPGLAHLVMTSSAMKQQASTIRVEGD